jgi:hypothetical protein
MKKALLILFLAGPAWSAGLPELNNEIDVLHSTANATVSAFNKIEADTNLNVGSLVNGGIITTSANTTVSWPIFFVASTFSVTAIQADLVIPSSFSILSIMAGPVAVADGKSVSESFINGNERFVVFGLNQNAIGSGIVAYMQIKIGAVQKGLYPMALINPAGSDAGGKAVLVSSESGTIEVE